MTNKNVLLIISLLVSFIFPVSANDQLASTYSDFVDDKGNISLPKNFQKTWVFLGAWSVAKQPTGNSNDLGAMALHNVYTQPEAVDYFIKHNKFPDGAIVIKELFKSHTKSMTTGTVSFAGEEDGWFVMVKDTKARFKGNPLWGDGWGWALFKPGQENKSVTQNYQTDCLGCHIPAKQSDWIYLEGYPILKANH